MIVQAVNCFLKAGGGGGGGTDPNFSSVKLLVGFEGSNGSTTFTDESPVGRALTANGNAQISTAQFKFGTSSGTFDGSGDSVSTPDSADFALGSGDFTVEAWVRLAVTNANAAIAYQWGGSIAASGILFRIASQRLILEAGNLTTGVTGSLQTWTAGTWYHVVGERSGSTLRVYRDGAMTASIGVAGTMTDSTATFKLGEGNAFGLNGQMDEFRLTKGVARYASDSGYTVPTAAFPRS